MKVAVVTLPLHTNYGGILQAYALKKVIEERGHEAVVIDRKVKFMPPPSWKMPFIYAKRILFNLSSMGNGPEVFRERRIRNEYPYVSSRISCFVNSYVRPRVIDDYSDIRIGEYDAFVVGSDQVWRPKYFGKIEDAYLRFASSWNVRRVAYAASFGTDQLEYTYQQLEACSALLKRFDAVSVREDSGVMLCDEWLDVEGVKHVLDPVMLLDRNEYSMIASTVKLRPAAGKALLYILDKDPQKMAVADKVSEWFDGKVHDASISPFDRSKPLVDRVVPSMEQWLSCFEDAEFIVTDSFHACVLAIIFHKPFIVLGNQGRGLGRITSLLEMFGLDSRQVHGIDPEDDGEYYMHDPDWKSVDQILEQKRGESIAFLMRSL